METMFDRIKESFPNSLNKNSPAFVQFGNRKIKLFPFPNSLTFESVDSSTVKGQ